MGIKLGKEHVGKKIYALPTGNNVNRLRKDQEVEIFEVISMGRKYVELCKLGGWGKKEKYHPETGATQGAINAGYSLNAGYEFFESEESIKEHQEKSRVVDEVLDIMRGHRIYSVLHNMTIDDLEQLKTLLEAKP